ncbi:GNAT family N-acetyltransferase [Calidifontibacter indicus]|uniref:GNAT family N-acetyltransferase n=1 Tax=Calidifontibacter indicus TaxID=419650 RepID=UPI003D70EB37
MSDRRWPAAVEARNDGHRIKLRPLRTRADRVEYLTLRRANADWNRPWDSSPPNPTPGVVSFAQMVRQQDREAKAGRLLPFALEVDGALVGQVHLFGISRGALLSASAGYWISESVAGQGIMPFALAMAMDHAFQREGLHRVEVNIRPDNGPSLRVVAKLGMRDEGVRRAYLHIDGAWRDHRTFALTTEDLAGERVVDRLNRLSGQSLPRHTD